MWSRSWRPTGRDSSPARRSMWMAASAPEARGGDGRRRRVMGGQRIGDIAFGCRTRFPKTVSESDVYLFAGITGDLDPNHVDEEYCRKTSLGHRVAHGALIVGHTTPASSPRLPAF